MNEKLDQMYVCILNFRFACWPIFMDTIIFGGVGRWKNFLESYNIASRCIAESLLSFIRCFSDAMQIITRREK